MQQIKDVMGFNGKWRSYQQRVLDHSGKYLNDKRVHIVAAPGSGKTTLGIELIRRLNAPCLILTPSVNIRDQWLERIREAFLLKEEPEGFLSNQIRTPGMITAITYQALHSGMTRKKSDSKKSNKGLSKENLYEEADIDTDYDNEVDSAEEAQDYSDFDFFATVKKAGITTICLDEAHHLRSEWWKALEEMVGKLTGVNLISLTATPPYDSTPAQWQRYIGLCGPIDEEIIVPELVKEGSLCPHQDYVYFNMPTADEENAVKKFTQDAYAKADALYRDEEFTRIISTHRGLSAPEECTDLFIQKPEYLSALLVFLQSKDIIFSKQLLSILGNGTKLPGMTVKWMEILLQGLLFEDTESFACTGEYIDKLKAGMRAQGLIQKNKVCLAANETIEKLLTGSKGKINSIIDITKAEFESLGEDLRLLILTDYIKKEYLTAVGDMEKGVNELGVIPIFENIRRSFSGMKNDKNTDKSGNRITVGDLRMGVLSGSVVLIPQRAKAALEAVLEKFQAQANIKDLDESGFYQVHVIGSGLTASRLLTELFNMGEIRVLIGTKSLLGEGWDSPCINSLILASFVGSFMLSNQMRGRAIRVMKGNPNKVSNIWHLICMQPDSLRASVSMTKPGDFGQSVGSKGFSGENANKDLTVDEEDLTQDFITLKRRFEGFLGVHYEKNVIENGLVRLSYIKGPYTAPLLEKINSQMLTLAADRDGLRSKWENTLKDMHNMELVVETGTSTAFFNKGASYYGAMALAIGSGLATILGLILLFPALTNFLAGKSIILSALRMLFGGVVSGIFGTYLGVKLSYLYRMSDPARIMRGMGSSILSVLKKYGAITSKEARVAAENIVEDGMCYVYLRESSEREKEVFAQSVYEVFGAINNPRYLLVSQRMGSDLTRYYSIPELFGKKKEDAALFYHAVKRYIGKYNLIYTRGKEGKQTALSAKVHSLIRKDPDCVCKKKTIKAR